MRPETRERLAPIAGLRNHPHVRLGINGSRDSRHHQRVIIDGEHSNDVFVAHGNILPSLVKMGSAELPRRWQPRSYIARPP